MKQNILIIVVLFVLQSNAQLDCSTKANSRLHTCASSTQPSCENPDPKFFLANCMSVCVCEPGFVQYNNTCIRLQDCPKDIVCSRMQYTEFRSCQSSTQPTCDNPTPMVVTADCNDRCVCKAGYVLDGFGCVKLQDCPGINYIDCSTKPNSIFRRFQSSRQPTCQNPRPLILLSRLRDMCVCLPGFILNNGECVPEESCPKPDCSLIPNSELKTGQSRPQPTCLNPNPRLTFVDWRAMCVCKTGFILHNGRCIRRLRCPNILTNATVAQLADPILKPIATIQNN